MSDLVIERHSDRRQGIMAIALILLIILLIVTCLVLLASLVWDRSRPLKPIRPSPSAVPRDMNSQPLVVTFPQLDEDPEAFQNQVIRVAGDYRTLPLPPCFPYNGPRVRWALISDELQMDAQGLEMVLRIVPRGTTLTVEGIWRKYEGPLGCGKEPPRGTAWYLEALRIVQPNPLPRYDLFTPTRPQPASVGTPVTPLAMVSQTPTASATATMMPTPSATPTVTATPTATRIPLAAATWTPTATITPTMAVTTTPVNENMTPTPTLPAGACLRIDFEVGGDVARAGRYEVRELDGRLLATWIAEEGWRDSGWIRGVQTSRPSLYVQVWYDAGDGTPPVKMRILNPAPGTPYGWVSQGLCHAIEVAWP